MIQVIHKITFSDVLTFLVIVEVVAITIYITHNVPNSVVAPKIKTE